MSGGTGEGSVTGEADGTVGRSGMDPDLLRSLVREVLADILGTQPAHTARSAMPATSIPLAPPATVMDGAHGYVAQKGPYVGQSHHTAGGDSPTPGQDGPAFTVRDGVESVETVSLRTDQELAAFVTRLLHLFENPKHRADLRAGRLRFRLVASGPAGSVRPAHRIDKGAVTEAAVRDAARAGARLVLGRRAVLTPLARDRARAAGVEIEKER
jgi:hypothetical protein